MVRLSCDLAHMRDHDVLPICCLTPLPAATPRPPCQATGRKKLLVAGIVTDVCVLFPTLSALAEGYEVRSAGYCTV